ncbi:MAG: hypothetical protein J6V72_09210 [Kiritimatiellae bacterium]|nr:hypothetical protein [Kiritimatiellia bacterium]
MGYYTGSGCVSGGGSTVSLYEHFIWYGGHNVYQLTDTVTTRKGGVTKATAQAEKGSIDMQTYQFWWNGNYHWSPNCKGRKKDVNYSQISDSNLYELTVTEEVIKAKLDNGAWVS